MENLKRKSLKLVSIKITIKSKPKVMILTGKQKITLSK